MRRDNLSDPVLLPLLRAKDEGSRYQMIQAILASYAAPQMNRLLNEEAVRRRLDTDQRQDLESEVTLRLFRKLRHLVEDSSTEPIRDFVDYVTATTHNVLEDHRRRQDPLRRGLAVRVRYVLTHTPHLALWGRDPTLCGLVSWRDRTDTVEPAVIAPVSANLANDATRLREILEDVLKRSGGPVDVAVLADRLADALGIGRHPFVSTDALREHPVRHDPLDRLASRDYLRQLWGEIQDLPERQRRALLLHLRLVDGESVCRVFVALGIVTVNALAKTMEMRLEMLMSIWNGLPLDDQRIASMLDVTRQQVINLRKSARERLARRMKRGG
jgi:DNA-directed RNA polymerase specialized sigma24 family protein